MYRYGLVILAVTVCSNCYEFLSVEEILKQSKKWREPNVLFKNLVTVTEAYIAQPVDHFDASINATYNMRYFTNEQYFQEGGPIIIHLGGEWQINRNSLMAGFVHDLGFNLKAMLYYVEHRYYGLSKVTESLSSKNLKHLSVDQALADYAFFIETMKHKEQLKNAPVIVIGGSYAGNIAVWLRMKYPHLVHGALASSAPVYAKADFFEYTQVVAKVFGLYGKACVNSIKQAFDELLTLVQSDEGVKGISDEFFLCKPLNRTSQQDVVMLFKQLSSIFAVASQYDTPIEGTTYSESICSIMKNEAIGRPLLRLAKLYKTADSATCYDYTYSSYVNSMIDDNYIFEGARQWMYQTCTEYGYYMTSPKDSIFGLPIGISFYTKLCQDIFGEKYNEHLLNGKIRKTNIFYGGRKPKVTNVIFTNGSKDPWHTLSVLENLNESSPSFLINGTSHCYDLKVPHHTDSAQLRQVRKNVQNRILKIIQAAKTEM